MSESDGEAPEPKRPLHKNPFLWGFLIGAALITLLPFLQKRMLRAPEPLGRLPSLTVETGEGTLPLSGSVWMISVGPTPCRGHCLLRQEALGKMLTHVADLGGRVKGLTLMIGTEPPPASLSLREGWHVARGEGAASVVEGLRAALAASAPDAGVQDSPADFVDAPRYYLVDQEGQVRGVWGDGELAQGNLINAARLLAKAGPKP